MTNHDDRHDIETRLRATLRARARDVDTTPALYEQVQARASRGAWLRGGLAVVAAAAAAFGAIVLVPALLPDPSPIDITDTPQDTAPATDESPGTDGTAAPTIPDELRRANVAVADETGAVTVAGRTVTGPAPVAAFAVHPSWTADAGQVAAALSDGRIGLIDQAGDGGAAYDLLVDATANGSGVAFSPDGVAIAWLEGTDLHVLPLSSGPGGERILPLEGDVPDDLRLEQWFAGADAQLLLASDPRGGVWRLPMDDSNAFNSAPTEPASLLPAAADTDAVDAALLPDLSIVVLRVPSQGVSTLTFGGLPVEEPDVRSRDAQLSVTAGSLTLHDPTTGSGSRRDADADSIDVVASWEASGIVAVAPLPAAGARGDAGGDASSLGLATDSPVVGTSGTDLLLRFADGEVRTVPLYAQPESEAVLGRVAVRPGSTTDDGLFAVESSSEGENSVRFARLLDGVASPTGSVLVARGAVTGLVWSEDGREIAWTDDLGLRVARVEGVGDVPGDAATLVTEATSPVLDWTWREGSGSSTALGRFAVAAGAGVEFLGVGRGADGTVTTSGPTGGSDRLVLDTHASPGAAVGPEVLASVDGGTARLAWSADGDQAGVLAEPGDVGDDVRIRVSGGHVLVLGTARQVRVTFDGDVVDLPTAADWDVLD